MSTILHMTAQNAKRLSYNYMYYYYYSQM